MTTEEERKAAFEQLVIENARLEKENKELSAHIESLEIHKANLKKTMDSYRAAREKELRPLIEKEVGERIKREVLQTLSEKFGWQWYD